MYRYHFSYKDPQDNIFLRGHNIYLEQDDFRSAIDKFNEEKPGCEIKGILKTQTEKKE